MAFGIVVAWGSGACGNANPGGWSLAASFLIPLGFCLFRASIVQTPSEQFSIARRSMFQIIVALAIVVLFIFEVLIGQIARLEKIPPDALALCLILGGSYVLLYCVAHQFVRPRLLLMESDQVTDGSTGPR